MKVDEVLTKQTGGTRRPCAVALLVAIAVLSLACSGQSGAPGSMSGMGGAPAGAGAMGGAASAGNLQIQGAWARPEHANRNGVIYFTVSNSGSAADYLSAVQTPVTDKAQIHETIIQNNVAIMRPVGQDVEVPAHGKLALDPGGLHVMLFDLKQELKAGDAFPTTLRFRNAGDVTVQVKVIGEAPPAS